MRIRVLNEGERLWQGVASWFRPLPSPWAGYVADEDVGVLMVAVLALNARPDVGELSLHNPWCIDSFPGGLELTVPDDASRGTLPRPSPWPETRKALGLGEGERVPDYSGEAETVRWVDARVEELREKLGLYSQRRR